MVKDFKKFKRVQISRSNEASVVEAELIGLEMLDIILMLDQANAIRLRSN